MKLHSFRDYFNPFEYWSVNLEKNEVNSRNCKYTLSNFVQGTHNGTRLIEPAEIIKFDSLMKEKSLHYQY